MRGASIIDFAPKAGAYATICLGVLCRFAAASTRGPAVPLPPAPVRCIAEFEPMEGLLIVWPLGIPADLVRETAKESVVFCVTNNAPAAAEEFSNNGIFMEHVRFIPATPDPGSFFTRDFGPLWVAGGNGAIEIVDPDYNVGERINGDLLPVLVGEALGVAVYRMPLLFAGGNFMTDGFGSAVSTDLVYKDNFELTAAEIAERFAMFLGIDSYLAVQHPLSPDWEPVEHIDCFAKFLAPDKIAVLELPPSHRDHAAVEAVAVYFGSIVSAYGKPYRIYRIASSGAWGEAYLNCTILNDKVLVPMAGTENDSAALDPARVTRLSVVTFRGRVLQTWKAAGDRVLIRWSGGGAASGLYMVRLTDGRSVNVTRPFAALR